MYHGQQLSVQIILNILSKINFARGYKVGFSKTCKAMSLMKNILLSKARQIWNSSKFWVSLAVAIGWLSTRRWVKDTPPTSAE